MEMQNITGTTLEERAQSLMDTELGSDCSFLVGQDDYKFDIKAHRAFLIRASPVFECMFLGQLQEKGVIEVPDIEPGIFCLMLKFVYGCKWSFSSNEDAIKLCYVANKYMISDLLKRCEEFLWPNDVNNLWPAFQCASMYSLNNLKDASMEIIRVNIKELLWSPEVLNISQSCLIDILKEDKLDISEEIDLFHMCVRWATAQCEEKDLPVKGPYLRKELDEAVKYIRFLVMSSDEFATEVVKSGILTTEESLVILCNLVTHGRAVLPCLLSTCNRTRGLY